MKNFFKKFGPSLLAVGGMILTAASPDIQAIISQHPAVAQGLAYAAAILAHILPSPFAPKPPVV